MSRRDTALIILTATIRRTDQGQGDWLDDLNRENP